MPRLTCILIVFSTIVSACNDNHHNDPTPTPAPPQALSRQLLINPVAQEEPMWCYAASTQMIFMYYRVPPVNPLDFQCGVVGVFNAYIYPTNPACFFNCALCSQVGGGSMDAIAALVNYYGVYANQNGVSSPVLSSKETYSPLSMQDVMTEILAGRPILAGISPGQFPLPDFSQHAVVIVGYDNSGGRTELIVNDPLPYAALFQQDPYTAFGGTELQPGQYSISYDSFVQRLVWANTLYEIQVARN